MDRFIPEGVEHETLYISGPMTGYVDFNRPLFLSITNHLRDAGLQVLSPHELTEGVQTPDLPWQYYMSRAVAMQMGSSAWVGLPGWTRSKGAKREFDLAVDLQHRLFLVDVRLGSDNLGVGFTYEFEEIA
jgi:hypothetical protein